MTEQRLRLVVGDDEFLAERAVSAVVEAARATDPGTVVEHYTAGDMTAGDLMAAVSPSLFGGSRVVVIRNGQQITLKVTLARQLEDEKKSDAEKLAEQLDNDGLAKPEGMDPVNPDDKRAPADKPVMPADTMGLTLSPLTAENRKQFSIPESVEGVLILEVPANSAAKEKGLQKGDVIVEIAQDFMESPEDVADKIAELKKDDRRNAYLMIANQKGELRLVAVPIE